MRKETWRKGFDFILFRSIVERYMQISRGGEMTRMRREQEEGGQALTRQMSKAPLTSNKRREESVGTRSLRLEDERHATCSDLALLSRLP